MKKRLKLSLLNLTAILSIALLQATGGASTVLITDFSTGVEVDTITWNNSTRTWSGTQGLGGLFNAGGTGPWDLTNAASLPNLLQAAVTATLNSSIPTGSFNITLEDNNSNLIVATFNWDQFSVGTPTIVQASFSGETISNFNLQNVRYWNLNSGNSGTAVNATFTGLSAVPEPSTGSMLLLGALGLAALRRLRKV